MKEPSRRELVLVALAAVVLSIAVTWPLALGLGTKIARDPLDSGVQAWEVAWDGYAVTHQPLHLFEANAFWPNHDALAFADALIGYAPAGMIGSGAHAALVRYNLLVLFSYALAFLGAYLLARELGAKPPAALVAGAAFAFAPWRIDQTAHLHVLSSGGIALALFFGLRGYRTHRPGMVVAGWLVATWQLSLGFTLGLQLAYVVLAIGVGWAAWWLRRGRPLLDRRLLVATVAGGLIFVVWAGLQAAPYLHVRDVHPEATRPQSEVTFYSPAPAGLLSAPQESLLWGSVTAGARDGLNWAPEQVLWPGGVIVALAVIGCAAPVDKRLRAALVAGVVVSALLSLGFKGPFGGAAYDFMYRHAPGWQGVRTPGRLTTVTTLGLALLGALGATAVLDALGRKGRRLLAPIVVGALAAIVVLEGVGDIPLYVMPPVPPGQIGVAGPQLHLPSDPEHDLLYMYWSTEGFPRIANGHGVFDPASITTLRDATAGFPDEQSIAALRSAGIRTVILHPDLTVGTPWEGAADKPVDDLDVTRVATGGVVVYEIGRQRARHFVGP